MLKNNQKQRDISFYFLSPEKGRYKIINSSKGHKISTKTSEKNEAQKVEREKKRSHKINMKYGLTGNSLIIQLLRFLNSTFLILKSS